MARGVEVPRLRDSKVRWRSTLPDGQEREEPVEIRESEETERSSRRS